MSAPTFRAYPVRRVRDAGGWDDWDRLTAAA